MSEPVSDHHHAGCHHDAAPKALDPVCGMQVDPAKTAHHAEHAGRAFHFCCAGCRTKFVADPAKYLTDDKPRAPDAPAGAIYTCPMHPEVRQAGPGSCPICGMALEPELATAEAAPNPELSEMTRRLWVAAGLTAPVFVLEMAGHLGLHAVSSQLSAWLQFALATPVVVWAGAPFFVRGWASLKSRHLNMFTLIAMGVGVAWLYSLAVLLAPQALPMAFRGHGGGAPVHFEAAAVITTLVLVGQVLELRARAQTSGAIRALLALAPKTARRVRPDGADEEISLEQIQVGDRLRVRPGEQVPVDGRLIEGHAAVDQSLVTGESMPVTRAPGDPVVGGSLNSTGSFVMAAEHVGADTLLARIVQMVAQAQRSRAPIQRLADRVAGWFVPAVLAVSALAFAGWTAFGPEPRLPYAIVAAVSVLIIACPCALGLATPMSIMVGVGRGAQAGVLIRDAEALERLEAIDTLVVDKTGTLTEGRPAVVAIHPAPGIDEAEFLRLAASLERGSEHPLAGAVLRAAAERRLVLAEPVEFAADIGKGVTGVVEQRRLALGSERHLADLGVDVSALSAAAAAARAEGATAIFLAIDGQAAGFIGLADPIRPSAPAAVQALRDAGVRLVMLTGDSHATAAAVAARLGIAEIEAEVSPQGKAAAVQRLRREGRRVAMAGDGINDAPALAAAEVGVAMGGGADVAIESAGVTLLGGDLAALLKARRLSRATMANIRQNLTFAFVYNAAGVPLAAGALYPSLGLTLSPQVAALAMALSSVSVVGNALRLRRVRLEG